MSKIIRIAANASHAKLLDDDKDAKKALTEILSYYVKGYENMESVKSGRWDGRSSMFDWESRTFPWGFITSAHKELTKRGFEVQIIRKALPEPKGILPHKLGGFSYTDRYDYQWQLVDQLEKRGNMIAHMACGAGKTFGTALAISRINRPTLILTKRQPLMYQFHERLQKFGFDPGLVGDNRLAIKDDLTVGMAQTIHKRITYEGTDPEQVALRDYMRDYLSRVEFIVGEEAHEISDNQYWEVVQACKNAYYRLGLTATPLMKGASEANMKLLGAFGPVGISVSEKVLIERGINAKPFIKFATYERPRNLRYGSNYQKAIEDGVTHCATRNAVIVNEALKARATGLPVLILVQRKEHGKVLASLLTTAGLRAEYIWGESDSGARANALDRLASGKIDVLIGSTIVDVGIDVPAVGLVIMAGGGKAEAQYRQRIGRGAREKPINYYFVLDFADEHNEHLYNHSQERKAIIKATPGFAEQLIGCDDEFPYDYFK